jgi:hypothetical protein
MKRTVSITVMIIVLILGAMAQAGVSIVMNGSFEKDGWISNIRTEPPYRWCDVSVPVGKFSGSVSDATDWLKHGEHYLILASYPYATFGINDMATISQEVYLTDVNEIIFNVKLDTTYDDPWDPTQRTAVLSIDDEVVWESNSVGPDVRGEYYDRVYAVEEKYKDADSHKLSLGIRADAGGYTYINYLTKWDLVRFDTHCGGFGYLPEDFGRDCYIDGVDLAMLVEQWLVEGPDAEYDLFGDGIINFDDYAFFTDYWMANSDSSNWRDDNCYEAELPATDLDDDGIVSFADYAILMDDWKQEVAAGTCCRGDIDGSGEVDYPDLWMLLDGWLEKSWLYGM